MDSYSQKVAIQQPKPTKSIMKKHKVKHHRNSDTKNRKQRTTSEPIKVKSKISDKSFGTIFYVGLKQKMGILVLLKVKTRTKKNKVKTRKLYFYHESPREGACL